MVTTLKDGGENRIFVLADVCRHAASLALRSPHRIQADDERTTGPLLAYPPAADVPFASSHNTHIHIFMLYHDPACFVMCNRTLGKPKPCFDSIRFDSNPRCATKWSRWKSKAKHTACRRRSYWHCRTSEAEKGEGNVGEESQASTRAIANPHTE